MASDGGGGREREGERKRLRKEAEEEWTVARLVSAMLVVVQRRDREDMHTQRRSLSLCPFSQLESVSCVTVKFGEGRRV